MGSLEGPEPSSASSWRCHTHRQGLDQAQAAPEKGRGRGRRRQLDGYHLEKFNSEFLCRRIWLQAFHQKLVNRHASTIRAGIKRKLVCSDAYTIESGLMSRPGLALLARFTRYHWPPGSGGDATVAP